MDQLISILKEAFDKAYIYVPTIMAIISAIGFPTLYKISEILSNTKLYLQNAKTIKDITKSFGKATQSVIDMILSDYQDELEDLQIEKAYTYNVKLKELYDKKIERIKAKIEKYKSLSVADLIEKAGAIEVKKVKVKVVKKDAK